MGSLLWYTQRRPESPLESPGEPLKDTISERNQLISLWTLVIVRVVLILLCTAATLWLLYQVKKVLLLIIVSVFFCYLIAPLVRLFEQPVYIARREFKLSKGWAIAAAYLVLGSVLFIGLQILVPVLGDQLAQLAKNMPQYAANTTKWVQTRLDDASSWMAQLKIPREWRDRILSEFTRVAQESSPEIGSVLSGVFDSITYLLWVILVPIMSFFMLKDGGQFQKTVVSLMPNERLKRRANRLLNDASGTLAAYVRAQITACLVVWVLATLFFVAIGHHYGIVLGAISALLEFIPMVGPLLAISIAFGLSLTISFKTALGVLLGLGVLRLVQDYVIYPRIIGHGIKMHPLVVVLAILAGAEVGGVTGVFLAIPVIGLAMVAYHHYTAYNSTLEQGITASLQIPPSLDSKPGL
ncbi:MAG: hypothetical protein DMF61_08725 [Blastocatellia bacterium AA13]|nr:MAG: hypothetical protein DMF61_08725 [Blastocatellia bacterium AA13]